MPNIGTLLKSEIERISKKAVRQETGAIKSASNNARKQLSALRKQVLQLEKELAALRRAKPRSTPEEPGEAASNIRFSAKGLRSLRGRLGLSAEDFGSLLNVSGATIYSWEREHTSPRSAQRKALAELRPIGKREALARLLPPA